MQTSDTLRMQFAAAALVLYNSQCVIVSIKQKQKVGQSRAQIKSSRKYIESEVPAELVQSTPCNSREVKVKWQAEWSNSDAVSFWF